MSAEVPEGWREGRLKDLCENVERRLGTGEKLELLSVAKRGVVPQSQTYDKEISSEDVSRYRIIEPGEFGLAPMALYYGAIGRYRGATPGIISPAYNVFRHTMNADPDYLETLIRMPRTIARYEALSQGGNLEGKRKLTPYDAFETVQIAIPPLPEQRAIANVLGSVEEVIANTEALIAALVDTKHATMRDLLTRGVQREKASMKPLPARWVLGRIAEGITHIPADWDLVTLTKVAKLESGHTPDRKESTYWAGNIPWISLQDADALTKVTISETAETIGPLGLANSSARMLPAGTVVLQRTANVGLASVMGREMCTSQHFANWICGSKLDPYYLQQVFRHMSREWQRLVAGSVLPDIYMGTFKALQILLPPLAEQKKIGEVGVAFDLRIEEERSTLTVLIENRKALAQELLSGRIRLPESIIAQHRDKRGQAA
ncbi:restriction endonuclease subunit S [Phyllobacterium sp. 21LDTY02-6]|uniref:restriction endonuclease subunit S n=1 Tax=Phyllobacterium sp. 21LDTY02-6 TaxID=2944903 RepID=UPI0020220878|nr:restriction endonuclease subunit S [Phyllobacterium sp. 21LDTY02-6]MCO4317326.1 restriction endonuclease subunit S [Phyllobacterium sp. 21LDTY02-6]